MECLHPYCPKGKGAASWADVLELARVNIRRQVRAEAIAVLDAEYAVPPSMPAHARTPLPLNAAERARLVKACPCLFNQLDMAPTARAVVHFCELTLGVPITSANVLDAFRIQHPKIGPPFAPGPLRECGSGGAVMEMLCSEVLTNAGIPVMEVDEERWPVWKMPGHVLLNEGRMSSLQALGDILIPCAPTNLVISIKSEVARERLLYSANSIEGIGFGFFKEPEEFWTDSRMALYKRMGFTAIYMPDETHAAVMARVAERGSARHATNINGTDLYRPLTRFGDDMLNVVGKSSALL